MLKKMMNKLFGLKERPIEPTVREVIEANTSGLQLTPNGAVVRTLEDVLLNKEFQDIISTMSKIKEQERASKLKPHLNLNL